MKYAKVVVGLAVSGPFDYIIPSSWEKKIKAGMRVWVNFCRRRMLGYVVDITSKTNIKKLKSILEIIDDFPILDKNMLLLTRKLSDYYYCSWGEAIETALPEDLRKGKKIIQEGQHRDCPRRVYKRAFKGDCPCVLVHDLDNKRRWEIYVNQIKEALDNNRSIIVLLPDIETAQNAQKIINEKINCPSGIFYRKQPRELDEWLKVKQGEIRIVIGTRSSIFAPVNNLGLVIIDGEENSVYKQEQVPHYHAREAAFMRIDIDKARLVLGSSSPTLESLHLAKKNKIKYIYNPPKDIFPEIKIIDTRHKQYADRKKNIIFSKFLQDLIYATLGAKGKILLFLNRKGFATYAFCHNCKKTLKCPRCNINLVYHFKENILNCHYCNFKMESPKICPTCNSGYIKLAGTGTEKIESELSRIFPQARIERLDNKKDMKLKDADIFVATSAIIKKIDYRFDLIGVLSIDNSLNHIDFRSSEKTFAMLVGMLGLCQKTMIIQTSLPRHHCFQAIENKDINIFYEEELKQRKQLGLPPYRHLILLKLRGKNEERAKEVAQRLFDRLNTSNKKKGIWILSVNPGQPAKLRGNFYWQVLLSADNIKKVNIFLKIHLKDFSHSGIIVTVDVDPL